MGAGTVGHSLAEETITAGTSFLANRLELFPLRDREHFPQVEIHHGVLAFQFAACGQNLVDFGADLILAGIVGIEQILQFQVFLFHGGAVVNQFQAVVKKGLIEFGNLGIAQLQFPGNLRILPPLSHFVPHAHLVPHSSGAGFVGAAGRPAPGPGLKPAIEARAGRPTL